MEESKSIYEDICDNLLLDYSLSYKFDINKYRSDKYKVIPGSIEYNYDGIKNDLNLLNDLIDIIKSNKVKCEREDVIQIDEYFHKYKSKHVINIFYIYRDYIINDKKIKSEKIKNLAISLIIYSKEIEGVKLGLLLISLFELYDTFIDYIKYLGVCEEFAYYINPLIDEFDNASSLRLYLIKRTKGYGKYLYLLYFNASSYLDINWIVKYGYQNDYQLNEISSFILDNIDLKYYLDKDEYVDNILEMFINTISNNILFDNYNYLRDLLIDDFKKHYKHDLYYACLDNIRKYEENIDNTSPIITKLDHLYDSRLFKKNYKENTFKKVIKRKIDRKFNIFDEKIDEMMFDKNIIEEGNELLEKRIISKPNKNGNTYTSYVFNGENNPDIEVKITCDRNGNIKFLGCGCRKFNCVHKYMLIQKVREYYKN